MNQSATEESLPVPVPTALQVN